MGLFEYNQSLLLLDLFLNIQMITVMLGEIVHFGVVMGVIMMGFTVGFFALLNGAYLSFGQIWVLTFKAMLGEIGAFDDVSDEAAYGDALTVLLVVYLIIMAVVLLNLLIAVLSTEHAKADGRSDLECNVSKVRMIRLYRRVVDADLMPPPFNLMQLAIMIPFEAYDTLSRLLAHDVSTRKSKCNVRRSVGVGIFWLISGPITIALGWVLWVVSVPHSMVSAWKGTNDSASSFLSRVLCCCAILPLHFLFTPIVLFVVWITSPIFGMLGVETNESRIVRDLFRPDNADGKTSLDISSQHWDYNTRVKEILMQTEGGLSVREIWKSFEDPSATSSLAMRRDEQTRPSTVENIRCLRNELAAIHRDEVQVWRASVESTDAATEARIVGLEGKMDGLFQKLEKKIDFIAEKLN